MESPMINYLRRTSNDEENLLNLAPPAIAKNIQRQMTGNSSSGDDTGRDFDTMFLLIILVMLFGLVVMTARMQCYFRYRAHEPNPGRSMPQEWEQRYHRRPKARTQEFIEKMLVLKNVFWVSPGDNDENEKTTVQNTKKSNLMLEDGNEEENGNQTCPICLGDYEHGDQICWSRNPDCAHHFHAACGMAWLAKHSECPICRAEYLVVSPTNNSADDGAGEGAAANNSQGREDGGDVEAQAVPDPS